MRSNILFLLVVMAAVLTSCQRVIDIKVKNDASLPVIEGRITNVTGIQTISISKSIDYDAANVYPPISGATVTVTNAGKVYAFTETKPGQYTNSAIKGKSGQSYALSVKIGDNVYTSTSTMPDMVQLDSIGLTGITVGTKLVRNVSAFYRDPPNAVNRYRFLMFVNNVQVKAVFAADDYLTNGRYVNTTLYQTDITLNPGDKVDVEMDCVDKAVYDYFFNLSHQGGNSPNDSATPSNPTSNITGGALGYFSANTVQKKSLVVL
ncbi:uncharacterized protein DUF4249 [Mucilaginibacter yixingensis]|uniref:Uncharacterized protein DUF4249 n=1 Tax=Mucilaginibacter yixingensis TaxID=1295612 RepID=A0A2T5JFM0_9SPHI|nr:DUF4249 domain-containing protein [Mucilaginibacter yixingensis]PTR01222.1 uncharacterized protein DUF4249 [Mucilaginibacter yixingensis]